MSFHFPPLVTFETKRTTGYQFTSDCFQENKHVHSGYQKGGYLRFSSPAVQKLFGCPLYQSAVTVVDAAGRSLIGNQSNSKFKLVQAIQTVPEVRSKKSNRRNQRWQGPQLQWRERGWMNIGCSGCSLYNGR